VRDRIRRRAQKRGVRSLKLHCARQTWATLALRALASAILLFILNLIGLGGGPTFVGWLSDRLTPSFGAEAVRYALLTTVVGGALWASFHYWAGARTLREDLLAKDRPR
jgi:hypothetical protein